MKSEENGTASRAELTARLLIVFAGLIGSYFFVTRGLISYRPTLREQAQAPTPEEQRLRARLWQDPLQVVEAFVGNSKQFQLQTTSNQRTSNINRLASTKRVHDLRYFTNTISGILNSSDCLSKKIHVLMVMLDGSPYAYEAETRLRTRYAILSGLGASKYSPIDAEHLDYFQAPCSWKRAERVDGNSVPVVYASSDSSITIPFEVFKPCPTLRGVAACRDDSEILVFWLRREDFEGHPLNNLARLMASTRAALKEFQTEFSLIGPKTSGDLKEMYHDLIDLKNAGNEDKENPEFIAAALNGLEIFSTWATAADAFIVSEAKKALAPRAQLAQDFETVHVNFHNGTLTDEQLAETLILELRLRGIDPANPKHGMVLLSEWDTFYGRALPLTFMAQAIRTADTNISFASTVDQLQRGKKHLKNFLRYSYLRGVDGEVSEEAQEKQKARKQIAKESEDAPKQELPQGQRQLDYIRRLAGQIRLDSKRSNIKAIGILGSDVYDKLLLIQALREQFPEVVFFTTDLQALYIESRHDDWCRNLLVASSFDLNLDSSDQRDIPPFRDSYQTAQFHACIRALSRPAKEETLLPTIFEIGRRKSVPLRLSGTAENAAFTSTHQARASSVPINWLWLLSVIFLQLLLLLLIAPFLTPFKRFIIEWTGLEYNAHLSEPKDLPFKKLDDQRWKCQLWIFFAALISLFAFELLLFFAYGMPDQETMDFLEGVSIWPTEALRLIMIILCVFFGVNAYFRLAQAFLVLNTRYFPDKDENANTGQNRVPRLWSLWFKPHRLVKDLWNRRKAVSLMFWRPASTVHASILFAEYSQRASLEARLCRAVPLAIIFCLIAALLSFCTNSNFRPYRGWVSNYVDYTLFWTCFATSSALLFFIVDAASVCRLFVDRLGDSRTEWPQDILRSESRDLSIEPQDLAGWLDVKLVAEHTERVGKLIYYPFFVICIGVIARERLIDNWYWPWWLIGVMAVMGIYAFYSGIIIRRSAEKIRTDALDELDQRIIAITAPREEWARRRGNIAAEYNPVHQADYSSKLQMLRNIIREESRGAFAKFLLDPAVTATFLPIVGAALVSLIEYALPR